MAHKHKINYTLCRGSLTSHPGWNQQKRNGSFVWTKLSACTPRASCSLPHNHIPAFNILSRTYSRSRAGCSPLIVASRDPFHPQLVLLHGHSTSLNSSTLTTANWDTIFHAEFPLFFASDLGSSAIRSRLPLPQRLCDRCCGLTYLNYASQTSTRSFPFLLCGFLIYSPW
jgi:hypothetical protein